MATGQQIANAAVAAERATRVLAGSHDGLHIGNHTGTWCWCNCSKCWQRFGPDQDGNYTGKCICLECPCKGNRVV